MHLSRPAVTCLLSTICVRTSIHMKRRTEYGEHSLAVEIFSKHWGQGQGQGHEGGAFSPVCPNQRER